MLNTKFCDFDKIRRIKNMNNRYFFKLYLQDIFKDLSVKDEISEKKVLNKLAFMDYIGLPYFISEKLFNVINPLDNILSLDDFVEGMNSIYNGNLEITEEIVFNVLDFDRDGFIIPEDVRLIINFIFIRTNRNVDEIETIINYFFSERQKLNLLEFISQVETVNSDIYFIIIYFILENAPFHESSINVYKMDAKRNEKKKLGVSEDEFKSMWNSQFESRKTLVFPTQKLSSCMNIDLYHYLNEEDQEEADLLQELESITIDNIYLPNLQKKTIEGIDKESVKKNEINSSNDLYKITRPSTYMSMSNNAIETRHENYIYKFKEKNSAHIRNKIWVVLINRDMYYFKDNLKEKIKKLHNLSGCFVIGNIKKYEFDGQIYYSFSIAFKNVIKNFYCDKIEDTKTWVSKLKEVLNQRNIYKDYEIISKIGNGGFGTVYLAENIKSKEKVAIKLYEKLNKSDNQIQAFKTEIEILKFCNHENIVRFIDSYEDEENIYLIQEYMNFGDLIEVLKCESILDEKIIKSMIKQIAKGLEYLHDFGIIHRDLKPQNILIKDYPENIILKICDFGLSKVMGYNETASDCLGTIYFSSPEIVKNHRYNNKVDVWSLGVMLYILLFGCVPFSEASNNQDEIGKKICREEYEIPLSVSDDVINLLKGCLDKSYQSRFNIKEVLKHKWLQ